MLLVSPSGLSSSSFNLAMLLSLTSDCCCGELLTMWWGNDTSPAAPFRTGRTTGGGDAHDDYGGDHSGVASSLLQMSLDQVTAHGG